MNYGLGRTEPPDFEHVDKYPALRMAANPAPPGSKKRMQMCQKWRRFYHQRNTPRCVGYGSSQERSLSERKTFDPDWLYEECKRRDGYAGDGTYTRVAYDVLKEMGHRVVRGGVSLPPDPKYGVERFEWARNIDEIRAALWAGNAVAVGTNWYRNMFVPEKIDGRWRLPEGSAPLGPNEGGHLYLLIGYDDDREAFITPNTWGPADRNWRPEERGWPVTEVPYSLMRRLGPSPEGEYGEAVLVVDR